MLFEANVFYTRNAKEAAEAGFQLFNYSWQAPGGETGTSSVYCRNQKEFETLLAFWNGAKTWIYGQLAG